MRRAGLHGVPQRRQWRKKPDITYVRTAEHWLYLCIVLDLYSGLVVGWSMSPRQDRQLVVHAVLIALWQRPARTPVILHSDQGCQFTSEEYQRFLEAHQVTCSMSTVGSCADNAAACPMEPALRQQFSFFEKYSAPCTWQASSITIRLYWSANSRRGSISAIWPYKWIGCRPKAVRLKGFRLKA